MKNLIIFVALIFLSINSFSQKKMTIYYGENDVILNDSRNSILRYEIIYKSDNKRGSLKMFLFDFLFFEGNFLNFDKLHPSDIIRDGNCYVYYPDGTKELGNYKDGKHFAATIGYDKEGNVSYTLPFEDGMADSVNLLKREYFRGGFKEFRANSFKNGRYNSFINYYFNKGDSIIRFFQNEPEDAPVWEIHSNGEKVFYCEFQDDFQFGSRSHIWDLNNPDEHGNIEIVDNRLQITVLGEKDKVYIKSGGLRNIPFFDFSRCNATFTAVFPQNSTAMGQGIEFGEKNENGNFQRVCVKNYNDAKYPVIIYEVFKNGVFIMDTAFDINPLFIRDHNALRVDVEHGTLRIIYNGFNIAELENQEISGNWVDLFGIGYNGQNKAIFEKFHAKLSKDIAKKENVVSFKKENGVYTIKIMLNGVLLIDFIFDSGASDVSISPDVALTLIRTGTIKENDWLPGAYYKFADGSVAKSKRFRLKTLKIGDKVVNDVNCSISNSLDAPMLLGQSVLSRFGKYTFDYRNETIKFE